MVGYVIVVLAIFVIIIGVLIYKQETTKFTKTTNYTLVDIWTKPDIKKASYFLEQLDRVEGDHEVLLNVDLPYEEATFHADAILIHTSGLYILTSVYKTGWIVGHEQGSKWVQIEHGNKKTEFENPFFNNLRIMHSIQQLLPDVSREQFMNVVVFGGGCSFQNIELVSEKVEVLKLGEVKVWKNTLEGDVLAKSDIDSIYQALKGYANLKKESKKKSKQKVAMS